MRENDDMGTVRKIVRKVKSGFLKEMIFELKWVFRLAIKYKVWIVLYTIISVVSTLIALSFSLKSKDLVDLLVSQKWSEIIGIAIYYVSAGAVNIGISMLAQRISAITSSKVKKEISQKVYDKIMVAEWQQVTKYHSGDLMARLNEDVGTISGCVVGWIPSLFTQGLQFVISVGVIVYYDVSMLLVIAVVAPIVLLGSRIFLGKVYEQNKKQRKVSSELMSFEKETFQNLQSIKAFGLKDYFGEKMCVLQNLRQKTDLDANKYSMASWAVMYISGQFAALICLGWAVYHVYTGHITLGTMALMAVLATTISGSFKSLIQLIPTAMSTVASSERIRKLLDIPEEQPIEEERSMDFLKKGTKTGISISIEDISFSYEAGKNVFQKVSFDAKPGEIVALVGPSGEGKTTMLRILLGILKIDEGQAYMGIDDSARETIPVSASTRKLIAYVPQGNTMMNGTIAENMRMVHKDTSEDEIIEALKLSCAWDFVKKLPNGIHHMIGESGIGFSEGQNQRLSIARALLCKTPILLLDEATSALDVATERNILRNLMKKDQTKTCILTTHRPSVLAMCSKVYRIANQTVIPIGEQEVRDLMNEF